MRHVHKIYRNIAKKVKHGFKRTRFMVNNLARFFVGGLALKRYLFHKYINVINNKDLEFYSNEIVNKANRHFGSNIKRISLVYDILNAALKRYEHNTPYTAFMLKQISRIIDLGPDEKILNGMNNIIKKNTHLDSVYIFKALYNFLLKHQHLRYEHKEMFIYLLNTINNPRLLEKAINLFSHVLDKKPYVLSWDLCHILVFFDSRKFTNKTRLMAVDQFNWLINRLNESNAKCVVGKLIDASKLSGESYISFIKFLHSMLSVNDSNMEYVNVILDSIHMPVDQNLINAGLDMMSRLISNKTFIKNQQAFNVILSAINVFDKSTVHLLESLLHISKTKSFYWYYDDFMNIVALVLNENVDDAISFIDKFDRFLHNMDLINEKSILTKYNIVDKLKLYSNNLQELKEYVDLLDIVFSNYNLDSIARDVVLKALNLCYK